MSTKKGSILEIIIKHLHIVKMEILFLTLLLLCKFVDCEERISGQIFADKLNQIADAVGMTYMQVWFTLYLKC